MYVPLVPKNKRQTNYYIEPPADLSTVIDRYDESIEDIRGEFITAPAKASSDRVWRLPNARFEPPSDLGKIASIIDEIVLRTNERAMHVNNPHEASRDWTWIINDEFEDNIDRALIRTFSWMNWPIEVDGEMNNLSDDDPSRRLSLETHSNPTIILFVQAPWILTKEDFKLFWTLESVRYIPLLTFTLNFRKDAKGKSLRRTYIKLCSETMGQGKDITCILDYNEPLFHRSGTNAEGRIAIGSC